MSRRVLGVGLTGLIAVIVATPLALAGQDAAATRAVVAKSQPFSAKLSYVETAHGQQQGAATKGIVGHGSFSAKLGAHAAIAAALISLATGVPVSKIAQGGSYVVRRQIAGNGRITGVAVVNFKAHGLGSACLDYTEKPGKFLPGDSFVPMTGTIKTAGGTRAAATWRVTVGFKQNSVGGTKTESFGVGGSEHASTGKANGMSAACKAVAKLA